MTQPAQTPAETITDLVATFLTVMFLTASNGNVAHARAAAMETINTYRARTNADLFIIAQIIAFGLAALGSLSLSMADDISLPMLLRLRGSACACQRAAEHNRKALQQNLTATPPPPVVDPTEEAAVIAQAAQAAELVRNAQAALRNPPEPGPQPQPGHQAPATAEPVQAAIPVPDVNDKAAVAAYNRTVWATACATVAQEYAAELPHLPPAKRWEASVKSQALSSSATALLTRRDLDPFRFRAPPK